MDTTFKHIGNVLSRMTDEELHVVLEQYMNKTNLSKKEMLDYFSKVTDCRLFHYDGSIREEIDGNDE